MRTDEPKPAPAPRTDAVSGPVPRPDAMTDAMSGTVAAAPVRDYLVGLQASIVARLEQLDGRPFLTDPWQRPEGGGGISRVLEDGGVFERAGVLFSEVDVASLPPSASALRPHLAGRPARAMGVSLVLHPRNPYVPTVHMNVRCFIAPATPAGEPAVWWFGGGMDLTPYYAFEPDVVGFHAACKAALAPFGDQWHPRFKRWCDDYFFLKHRQEPRGVGGVFFDDLNEPGFDTSFAIMRSVGDAFLTAYAPIVERRRDHPYGERERGFQSLRRGRYVEFNLVFDRGTLFGLHSGGRTESILCSMPPTVSWRYDWRPEPGSAEARLLTDFLPPREWV